MRYLLDPSQGRFTIQAFARGALSAFGHSPTFAVREYTGELDMASEKEQPVPASLHITAKADSLALTDPVSAKDRTESKARCRGEVLETAVYPEIVFSIPKSRPRRSSRTGIGFKSGEKWICTVFPARSRSMRSCGSWTMVCGSAASSASSCRCTTSSECGTGRIDLASR